MATSIGLEIRLVPKRPHPRLEPLAESKAHTPIYKQHRYFARRPHNQFRALIESATAEGEVILDCMAGGGTTLVEGLSCGRRVISVDINPIAALVQAAQVAECEPSDVEDVVRAIVADVPADYRAWYTTLCRGCGDEARVRWYERAYVVACPDCDATFPLEADAVVVSVDGKKLRGKYVCSACDAVFRAANAVRMGSILTRARVKCACGLQETRPVTPAELALDDAIQRREPEIVERYDLKIPCDSIPHYWDRQHEDGLQQKGIDRFSDLFTSRNRMILAFLLQGVRSRRASLDEATYLGVLIVTSALIRYVNNMVVSTPGWMDGRPVAWAKHAYWIPNEFVECNPYEYLEHRLKALRSASKDRKRRFRNVIQSHDPRDVIQRRADYSVVRADARSLPLPSRTIDVVITDPPFGSNVQYGELTSLWSVWLDELNPYACDEFMQDEILVTRRRKIAAKTFDDYEKGLRAVFQECCRVLKDDGALIFTFNNRDARAWQAVMRAAFVAGFSLRREDIAYQSEIHAYRDTAHLRFGDDLQGDVVYAFRKSRQGQLTPVPNLDEWRREAEQRLSGRTGSDLQSERVAIHLESLADAAAAIEQGLNDQAAERVAASLELVSRAGRTP
jgi:putative DNA methylase